jgi:hypothetical protein
VEDYGEEEAFIKTVEDDVLENKYSSDDEIIKDIRLSHANSKGNTVMRSSNRS